MYFSQHLINNRTLTLCLPTLEEELQFLPNKNYLFDLSFLSILAVEGERGTEFLQGQVSCDVRKVNANCMQSGALCHLNGRVLALFDLIQWQGLKLILPQDLISTTKASLNKVALLSRVSLQEESAYSLLGFYLAQPQDPLTLPAQQGNTYIYPLNEHFFMLLLPKNEAEDFSQRFYQHGQLRGSLAWHYQMLLQKRMQIYPETRGLFLPHRLNLHQSGHLNFDKGCYKGQEIIARTHYRAKLKHSLHVYKIETSEPLQAGKPIFAANCNQEIGELIDYCPISTNHFLIIASLFHEHPAEIHIEGHAKSVFLSG